MFQRPSLSVIAPCRNESRAIPRFIPRLKSEIDRLVSLGLIRHGRIVVVDDASDDGSHELLSQYGQEQILDLIRLERNSGYGFALKTAFGAVNSDLICFMDLDGSYDPADMETMIRELERSEADIVLGDRLSQPDIGLSKIRRLGNAGYTLLIRKIFDKPVRDVCSGLRVFRSSLTPWLITIPQDQLNYSLSMTLASIRQKVKIREVPIRYHPRLGRSKLSVTWDGVRFLATILFAAYAPDKTPSLTVSRPASDPQELI